MLASAVTPEKIAEHYERFSGLYLAFWGRHIHHGYWPAGIHPERRSAAEAQEALVELLASVAGIAPGSRVLDVGSGLGGSAVWLALNLGCRVDGITLSPAQVTSARQSAARAGVAGRVTFEVRNAETLDVEPGDFDAVWVVECSEHLADKPRFLETCATALRPGGILALCAWLEGPDLSPEDSDLVRRVCEGMLCPSLGSERDYRGWIEEAGFMISEFRDLTRNVERTWHLSAGLLERFKLSTLLPFVEPGSRRFLEAFDLMRQAYAGGAMAYGLFAARKPA